MQGDVLPQDTCAVSERCAPCYDPLSGTETGACRLSCDLGPTRPPVVFAQCCSARGHCIPEAGIPEEQAANLAQDSCSATNLCVPDQLLTGAPIDSCTASLPFVGSYTGVCLEDCLNFGAPASTIPRGSCVSGYKCAPCEILGSPTGAPGCPM